MRVRGGHRAPSDRARHRQGGHTCTLVSLGTHHDFIEVLVWAVAAGGPEDSPATLVNEGDSRRGQLLPCMHVHGPYGCVGGLMGGWIGGGMGGCEWHVCMSTDDGS